MIRKFILGTASVLALGIAGSALDYSADADATTPSAGLNVAGLSQHWLNVENLSKDDVRWAQLELRNMGLYNGSLDGVVGPETRQALAEFQKSNGLEPTAQLDQRTADALLDNSGVSQGSSVPSKAGGRSMINSSMGASGRSRAKIIRASRNCPK